MALYYDIKKVIILQEQKFEQIAIHLKNLSTYLNELKAFIREKNYMQAFNCIEKIIFITDVLGIDSAYEEALQIQCWAKSEGKKKEISTTLKEMVLHCKNAIKEIQKDFSILN